MGVVVRLTSGGVRLCRTVVGLYRTVVHLSRADETADVGLGCMLVPA